MPGCGPMLRSVPDSSERVGAEYSVAAFDHGFRDGSRNDEITARKPKADVDGEFRHTNPSYRRTQTLVCVGTNLLVGADRPIGSGRRSP